ncbi:MAG: LysR family transcriptional regulator [Paludibacterium sp.]|uniref:LysR substrate-binding domain-containing protein n=1 Tax=Paludibacterium sp. TaxID=1917523 RepID=UPI0025E71471|nr:LysR substrate-binding domain-containing protein [Paludibacterium sp.]MBV8047766.1 LysR family transcriptional regulator [Paludibacterium sp.]MBV8648758.1 LysR family transcriptional regulator [Paludibacterium sp.]
MIDEEITLRKLEVLVAFLEQGNLPRTADALQLSTVSVHRALHSLENAMRCPLFRHEGRTLKPLPSAELLAQRSTILLSDLERAVHDAQALSGHAAQRLRVGTLFSLSIDVMPRLIMGMKTRRPEVSVELIMGSNAELLFRLNNLQIDAAMLSLAEDLHYPGMEVVPMFRDDIYLASPPDFRHPRPGPADLRDYQHEKFVSLSDGFATCQGFKAACEVAGFTPQVALQVNDIFSLTSLVSGGVGHALLPGRVKDFFADKVCFTPLKPEYQMQQNLGLLFLRTRERDPNILALAAETRMVGHSRHKAG